MNSRLLSLAALVTFAAVGAVPARAAEAAAGDPAQERIRAAVAKVFDTSVLHRIEIEIEIPPKDVAAIVKRTDTRISCTFTFDGVRLENVGVRQAGGVAHPYLPLTGKPNLSLKFNEFVKGQKLHGIDKLVLKNGLQDMSYVNEHLTYEVFRRAGLAAPMTAHAIVTLNGQLMGIYVMREPINPEFLVRNFGSAHADGNLYEIEDVPYDVINRPETVSLKDEREENRSRADLLAMARAVRASRPQNFVETVGPHVDLPRYLTYSAVELATSYYDGFSFHNNNTYLYMHPRDGKMILLPSGADETFWAGVSGVTWMRSSRQTSNYPFARAFRAAPGHEEAFRAEVKRVGQPPIWDQAALLDRVAQVARILATAERRGRTATDLARFEKYRPQIEKFIRDGGTTRLP